MNLVTVVTHAPWEPGRAESLARLRADLGVSFSDGLTSWDGDATLDYIEFTTKAVNWAWSEIMWKTALESARHHAATHALFLQDDVRASPHLWKRLHALLEGRPHEVVSFSSSHPAGRTVFLEGAPGYTTPDGLVGYAYALPVKALAAFLDWREKELIPYGYERMTEDSLLGLFCMAVEHKIFHPTPSLFDHDLEVDSTYGNGANAYRRPLVTWKDLDRSELDEELLVSPDWWAREAPHVGRFYEGLHRYLPLLLADHDEGAALAEQLEADRPEPRFARYFPRIGAVPGPARRAE